MRATCVFLAVLLAGCVDPTGVTPDGDVPVTGAGAAGPSLPDALNDIQNELGDTTCELLGKKLPPDPGLPTPCETWKHVYNGPANNVEAAQDVAVSADGTIAYATGFATFDNVDAVTYAYRVADGNVLWRDTYTGPANDYDAAYDLELSRDGKALYVGGYGRASSTDYALLRYDAETGQRAWVYRYDGNNQGPDLAFRIALSPDGRQVFLTGDSEGQGTDRDLTTVAVDAATGAQLWVARYDGPAHKFDRALAIAASPRGDFVYAGGWSDNADGDEDLVVVAMDAATGATAWLVRYDGPTAGDDRAYRLRTSPDGDRLYVAGFATGPQKKDYLTLALDAKTGRQVWSSVLDGQTHQDDEAWDLAVSPDGATVLVTGEASMPFVGTDALWVLQDMTAVTVAYDAADGRELWRDVDPDSSYGRALAVSTDGSTLYVTGNGPSKVPTVGGSGGASTYDDVLTGALDVRTGERLWAVRFDHAGYDDFPEALVASASHLVIAGEMSQGNLNSAFGTVAYRLDALG